MSWRDEAEAHAMAARPAESCGLLVRALDGAELYWPCRNLAGEDEFQTDPEDLARAEDLGFEVLAVVHSHPGQGDPAPSAADIECCDAGDLPWHIVGVPPLDGGSTWNGSALRWIEVVPAHQLPDLVGRPFEYGRSDCYSIVRDWYRLERGVWLADVPRTSDTEADGSSIYLPRLQAHGWRAVSEPRPGDVLLMRMGAREANHSAVYLGDNLILHHLEGRLSAREPLGADYLARTTHILRHASDPS